MEHSSSIDSLGRDGRSISRQPKYTKICLTRSIYKYQTTCEPIRRKKNSVTIRRSVLPQSTL